MHANTPDTCFLAALCTGLSILRPDLFHPCWCLLPLPRTSSCRCARCWQHQHSLFNPICSRLLLLLVLLQLQLLLLMLLLKVLAGCQQRLPLCCILDTQLQESFVCQLHQLLPRTALRQQQPDNSTPCCAVTRALPCWTKAWHECTTVQ
jgi:hypothetical protein